MPATDHFQDPVGGDVDEDVEDVEDGEGDVVLVAGEIEVLNEAVEFGVSWYSKLELARRVRAIWIMEAHLPMLLRSMKANSQRTKSHGRMCASSFLVMRASSAGSDSITADEAE